MANIDRGFDMLTRGEALCALQLINGCLEVRSCDSLSTLALGFRELLEVENLAFAYVNGDGIGSYTSYEGVNVTFPAPLAEHYVVRDLPRVDPFIRHQLSHFGLTHWRDFAVGGELGQLYGDYGIREAYLHGLPVGGTHRSSLLTVSGGRMPAQKRTRAIIGLFMPHLHQAIVRILGTRFRVQADLSGREIEVLKWISMGKSAWDISMILGISERTANFHATNIINKLGASNRAHAVAIAMDCGALTGL